MAIRLFVTGGTFDKEYNELTGQLFFKDSQIHEILKLGRSRLDLNVTSLMLMDSLDMTNEHRNIILDSCQKCDENKIVISHGTDTMTETAKYLSDKIPGKTVVITGAMIPYKFGSSDGLFNMGSALAFVQSLPAGIYIAMNGRYYDWNNCKKNKQTGFFEELG